MLQIDALSYAELRRAIELGYCPTISQMVREEGYTLRRWFCGLPVGNALLPGRNLSRRERGHSRVSLLRQGGAPRHHVQHAVRRAVHPRSHPRARARWPADRAT